MPSHLRNEATFAPFSAHNTQASYPHLTVLPVQKKQKMTVTQTYRLAHSARGKLSSEASRGDHDLRLLVGHANLLDSLMLELQDAENEQEMWFNETMKNAAPKSPEEPKHIQWRDEVISQHQMEVADDEQESDSDYEDDSEDEFEIPMAPIRRSKSPPPAVYTIYEDEEDVESDDEYDSLELALVRTQSHSTFECPELVHDASDDSDDECPSSSAPTTPPGLAVEFPQSQKQEGFALQQKSEELLLEEDGYFLSTIENQPTLIAAY